MQNVKEKIRIYALAKEWKVDSKVILDYCKELGFDAKNQLSALEPEQVDALTARKSGSKAGAARPAPQAPLPTALPKPIRTLPKPAAPPKLAPEIPPEPVNEAPAETLILAEAPPTPRAEAEPALPGAAPEMQAVPTEAAEAPTPIKQPAASEMPTAEATSPVEPAPVPAIVPAAPKLPSMTGNRMMNLSGKAPTVNSRISPVRPAAPAPEIAAAAPREVPAPMAVSAPAPTAVAASAAASPAAPPTAGTAPRPGGPSAIRPMTNMNTPRPGGMVRPGGPAAPAGSPLRPGSPMSPARPGGPSGLRPGGPAGRTPVGPGLRGDPTKKPGSPGSGVPAAKPGDKKAPPAPPAPKKFTPEELKAMREGKSLLDIMREQKASQLLAAQEAAKAAGAPVPTEVEGEDGDDKKPKVPGRDNRHKERAKRAEKRKTLSGVVIKDGHAEVIENEIHYKNRNAKKPKRRIPGTVERKGKVPLALPISVRSLSEAVGLKAAALLFKLKDLTGQLYTINSMVSLEVAELIADENGIEFEIQGSNSAEDTLLEKLKIEDDPAHLVPRAPVVTIMGHVDHGKTSLLDRIRASKVVDTEIGGITQVIRAWRVERDGKPITFLDTPGHEAFTKMRARGANVTDIVVIVVAADSGVKPQTEEAIAHAKAAGVSIVVAINKIDLPNADIKKTESQLYSLGLLPDTMGGDSQFVYTSAATGKGIDELLDTLALVAEIKELKANPDKQATGTCLEAYMSADEGVMATVLVRQGTLRKGDVILCGGTYGRVRAMYNDLGKPIEEAGPSVPVRITGLDDVPNADDHFTVVGELADAREIAQNRTDRFTEAARNKYESITLDTLSKAKTKITELKIILKAEARGSVEAIKKELEKLVHEEVRVRVLHAGIGAITESDVQLALTAPEETMVIGFNVVPDDAALRMAEERGIPLREYNIIYNLTDDIKQALEGKLKPREEVVHLGRAVVRDIFKISRTGTIAGCHVTQGTIERSSKIRVIRDGGIVYPPADRTASLESLKRFKDDQKEVREGFECGLKVAGYDDIKVGDVIEAYRIDKIQRTLD